MIRNFCLIVLVVQVVLTRVAYAQESDYAINMQYYYDSLTKKNFEIFGIDWSLPPTAKLLMEQGLKSISVGDWKLALNYFSDIIEIDSTFLPAYYFRYSCFQIGRKVRHKEMAGNDFKYVIDKLSHLNMEIYVDFWNKYDPNKANARLKHTSIEIAPPFFLLSDHLVKRQKFLKVKALDSLRMALSYLISARPWEALEFVHKSNSNNYSALEIYLRAFSNQLVNRHDSAFALYTRLIELDDHNIEAHENLARYKFYLNDKDGVLHHLTKLTAIAPDSPSVWRFNGILKIRLHEYANGIKDISKYLRVDSMDSEALKHRGIANFEMRNYTFSIIDLKRAIKINRNDLEAFFILSDSYLKIGDQRRSLQVLHDAKRTFSFNQQLDLFKADKLIAFNKISQAREIIDRVERIVSINNFNKKYTYQINSLKCKIFLQNGENEKALDSINLFIKSDGEQLDYLLTRAKILIQLGKKYEAGEDLQKLIKINHREALSIFRNL